jgi:hypothetical protein
VSKPVLIGVIAAAVLAVGTLAAVTATVIVDDGDGGTRAVLIAPAPGPGLLPPGRGRGGAPFFRGTGPNGVAPGINPLPPGTAPLPGPGGRPVLPGSGPFRGFHTCLRRQWQRQPGPGAAPRAGWLGDAFKACRDELPAFPRLAPRTR